MNFVKQTVCSLTSHSDPPIQRRNFVLLGALNQIKIKETAKYFGQLLSRDESIAEAIQFKERGQRILHQIAKIFGTYVLTNSLILKGVCNGK